MYRYGTGVNLSNKVISNKIIILITVLVVTSAIALYSKDKMSLGDKNNSLLTGKKEPVEYTSKRILAIISDNNWRAGHIQFDQLKLMGFNLTLVKASEYKADMLNNADVVMFDYEPDSVDIKDKDSIRNFVEKKGNNVIFISPAGLSIWWKKERYSNTPFIDLSIKATETKAGLNISGQFIPSTQYDIKRIYQLNRVDSRNIKIWKNYYFALPKAQVPIAYTQSFPSGGHYIIYSGSHLTLLPPELIQSLIYLDKTHFEAVYTKDNIKNNFTYLIRIDDVGYYQSKKLGRKKDWDNMSAFDKLADDYGFGVNHLVVLNRTQGADDVLTYLRGYKNGKWIAVHGWNHDKPDGAHPEFEMDDKAFQEDTLRKSKERFYELFGYYPEYIATPWNEHRYNFSKNISDNNFGSLTLFKKYGIFVYSLYAEQGNTYTPFMVDDVIVIQQTHFGALGSLAFDRLISGANGNGWIIENYGHYFDKNISQDSNAKFAVVSRYNVWNPDPNELAEFLHSISGLEIDWRIDEKDATIELKSNYVVPAGFTLKLMDSKSINEAYIDNTSYNYFTDKKLVFPELGKGVHIVKIFFKK